MKDWYEKYIEKPIRDIVKLLRDNGYNTTCSCGHEMAVDCEYYGEALDDLMYLLTNNGHEHFTIRVGLDIHLEGKHGKNGWMIILFPKEDGKFSEAW